MKQFKGNAFRKFEKLSVRRACRALGCEAQLDLVINATTESAKDWNDANIINLEDEVLIAALQIVSIDVPAVISKMREMGLE